MKTIILTDPVDYRHRPLKADEPETMLPVLNKPVLEYIIEHLARHDIKDIVINVCRHAYEIESYFGDGKRWGVSIRYSLERETAGTAGAVRRAIGTSDETTLVITGNAITDIDPWKCFEFHKQNEAAATIVLKSAEVPDGHDVTVMDTSGRVIRFEEKSTPGEAASNFVDTGIYFLEGRALEMIPGNSPFDISRDLLPRLVSSKDELRGYVTGETLYSIGNLDNLLDVNLKLLKAPPGNLNLKSWNRGEGLWIGSGTRVSAAAVLTPPLYIGDNCIIAPGASIGPNAVIGDWCLVEKNASVENSLVFESTSIGEGVEIADRIAYRGKLVDTKTDSVITIKDAALMDVVEMKPIRQLVERISDIICAVAGLVFAFPVLGFLTLLTFVAGARWPIVFQKFLENSNMNESDDFEYDNTFSVPVFSTTRTSLNIATQSSFIRKALQLYNVIRGEMGIIGTAPVMPDNAINDTILPDVRFPIKPGIIHPASLLCPPGADNVEREVAAVYYSAWKDSNFYPLLLLKCLFSFLRWSPVFKTARLKKQNS